MVCAICMRGAGVNVPLVVPSIAREFAMSFPTISVYALAFWILMLCWNHVMCCIMDAISNFI